MIDELAAFAKHRGLVRTAAAITALMFLRVAIIYTTRDPQSSATTLTASDLSWWEVVLVCAGVCSLILLWMSGVAHAWRSGHRVWLFASLVFWPLGVVYVLLL